MAEALHVEAVSDSEDDNDAAHDDVEDEEDEVIDTFSVERVLAEKNGLFLVRWSGYSSKDDTWEPEEHFVDRLPITLFRQALMGTPMDPKASAVVQLVEVMDGEGEAVQQAESYEEHNGYQLQLSSKSATGYTGVTKTPSGKFDAKAGNAYVGKFATVLEAAVAIAKVKAAGERPPPPPPPTEYEEHEGYQLVLSSTNATGYAGVSKKASGKFEVQAGSTQCRTHIGGGFDTAREAAVARAKFTLTGELPPTTPEQYEEHEGYQLLLSSTSNSGYKGVTKGRRGKFDAKAGTHIGGGFATAIEAAVYLAKHKASQPGTAAGKRRRTEAEEDDDGDDEADEVEEERDEGGRAAPRCHALTKIATAASKLGELRKRKKALEEEEERVRKKRKALEEEEEQLLASIAALSNP